MGWEGRASAAGRTVMVLQGAQCIWCAAATSAYGKSKNGTELSISSPTYLLTYSCLH